MTNYQPVIGLEVHVELATVSKMFCGCPASHFGKKPNTQTCPVCLGLPGALPVPNKKAVEWTILLGLALGCVIPEKSKFDRKNYFYPDIPKGYQISQYDEPLCVDGGIVIGEKSIRIRRVHLEEDTGKLQHATVEGKKVSLVDYNRSGVALVEIVTEPDFNSIEDVDLYLKKLQQIITYLGISEAEMEKGTMRLEPSISLRKVGEMELPHYRVELKNINSFRFARKALEYEIKRQAELLDNGEVPSQQTRGWSEDKNATVPQRDKEEAEDYRYFPEPDIPPMSFRREIIDNLRRLIPELPDAKKARFVKDYAVTDYDASQLVDTKQKADYFEEAVRIAREQKLAITPKHIANWMINKKINIDETVPAWMVEQIVQAVSQVLLGEGEVQAIISEILKENPKAVADYKSGKETVIMFLIGQVMKKTQGKVDKNMLPDLLKRALQ